MAVTGGMGDVTNTFAYDAYGRLTEKVGLDDILFCYNGKYGVITEPNGLVYMRARYYSPELRRFINADVVAGEISNAITLNRYAYANGNPISNVDPLGLEAQRTIDREPLLKVIEQVLNGKEELSTELLAMTLDQLMNFKNIFAVSGEVELFFPAGGGTVYFSTSVKSGKGNFEVASVISDQLELLGSMSFSESNITYTLKSNRSISIEYSYQVDDYTSVAVSLSASLFKARSSISADYTVRTTDDYGNSVSMSIGLESQRDTPPSPPPVVEPVPEPEKETVDVNPVFAGVVAFGAIVIAAVAIADDIPSGGGGIVNDGPALTLAWEAIKNFWDAVVGSGGGVPALGY